MFSKFFLMRRLIVYQNIEREGPGLFQLIAKQYNYKIVTCRTYLDEFINDLDYSDCVLILGGPMGIKDIDNPI